MTQKRAVPPEQNPGVVKKPYAPPNLMVYGNVKRLINSASRSADIEDVNPQPENLTKRVRPSDRRAKKGILRLGQRPCGVGIYLFSYKQDFAKIWGNSPQIGYMADEVEKVVPQAVSVHADGFKRVDYALLDALALQGAF